MPSLGQELTIYRGDDVSIVLTGAFASSPAGWVLQFSVARARGKTPVLTVTTPTITVSGSGTYTATIPLTRAQTSLLSNEEYYFDLHRTDAGSVSIKADGRLKVVPPVYPPA